MKMKNLKKILAIIFVCVMLIPVLAGCGSKEKMIIGITDYFPMNYKDDNGKWTGFETEFAQEVCKILGYEASFIEVVWDSKEAELKGKTIDAVWNGMTVTPEREEEMAMSTHYMKNRPVIVVRSEDAEKYQTADGLAGASIVAEAGSTLSKLVTENEFFAQGVLTEVDSQIKSVMEVKALTADAAVVDYVMAGNLLKAGTDYAGLVILDIDFPEEEYAVGLRKEVDENEKFTVEAINDAIKQLQDNGKLQEIADKYGLGDLLIK